LLLSCPVHPLSPPSFPTRRSSDLVVDADAVLRRDAVHLRKAERPRLRLPLGALLAVDLVRYDDPLSPGLSHDAGGGTVSRKDPRDRKSTRLNSSHRTISYAVFCLK